MNIDYPIIYEIAYKTYAVNEFGMSSFFILVGQERGLVIDCGCGSFAARELVERLCPVPYDVAITHAHGEHCGGMGFWDKVWIHPLDIELASDTDSLMDRLYLNKVIWHSPEERGILFPLPDGTKWVYPSHKLGARDFYCFKTIEFNGLNHTPEFLPLRDGQIFRLDSSRKVSVMHVPGHSLGHCVFLDEKERILFSGDACYNNYGIHDASVNTALKGLLKIQARSGEFDRNFCSHTASGADTAGFSLPPFVLTDCIEACRRVLDGSLSSADGHLIYKSVCLKYSPDRLLDPDETPILD